MTRKRDRFGPEFYMLKGKLAVPVNSVEEWARVFEDSQRIVRQTHFQNAEPWLSADTQRHRHAEASRIRLGMASSGLKDEFIASTILVSTVFLGLNMRFGPGLPLLFETMVFNGPLQDEMARYSTWQEAEAGHDEFCDRVKTALVEQEQRNFAERLKQ